MSEVKPYRAVYDDPEVAPEYEVLVGPNGFRCVLTEPEDRCWFRDLRKVVDRLNELHEKLQEKEK